MPRTKKVNEAEITEPLRDSAKAIATNIGVTPRKARLVVDLVRGKTLAEAYAILANTNKAAVTPVIKVIKSAEANAVNNFKMKSEDLYIAEIYATDGIRLKRFLPRAKGSASGLIKRFCNITVVVKMKGAK